MLYLHHTKYLIMHNPDDKPGNCFILLVFSNFSIFTQYMSVSHGHSTICGIERWLWGRQKKEKIVSHQLGVSTGYGDAHQ